MNKYYVYAVFFFFIGSSYLFIPLYKWLCILEKQDTLQLFTYFWELIQGFKKFNLNYVEWIRCSFLTRTNSKLITIIPITQEIILKWNEPLLCFYKLYNNTDNILLFNSHIYITPSEFETFFIKIQCFCFQEQLVNKNEILELPIFFFMENINSKYALISKHLIIHLVLYVK